MNHNTQRTTSATRFLSLVSLVGAVFLVSAGLAQATGVLGGSPETAVPVHTVQGGVPPLVMLTMARDHTLFFPAYNDLSDIDGDGNLDIRFKPNFEYVGLYNPYYCYSYSGTANSGLFTPAATATLASNLGKNVPGKCPQQTSGNTLWSGNFLNYVTTSRIDALRVVLYGGYREVDSSGETILRRAYIPQDGHAWAKEYTSFANDGYYINDYTPLAPPSADRRHFFGNLTSTAAVDPTKTYTYNGADYPPVGISCKTLNDCSGSPPLLRVVTNSDKRVWNWASSERPVLSAVAYPKMWTGQTVETYGTGTLQDFTVRVKVCTSNFTLNCKAYTGGANKPTGVLHDYGEDGTIWFGLLTGSYDQNMSGGRLRKNISNFGDEVSTNGLFKNRTTDMVTQINNIRIRNFSYYKGPDNNDGNGNYYSASYLYRNGLTPDLDSAQQAANNGIFNNSYGSTSTNAPTGTHHLMTEGEYGDWGNPIAEMMYEGLRYFGGKEKTAAYNGALRYKDDVEVGLVSETWSNPYNSGNWCAKPSQVVISSASPSFDSDQLPGSYFSTSGSGNSLTPTGVNPVNLDVKALADTIGSAEGIDSTHSKTIFIGRSGTVNDGAPTLKSATSFGALRGLPPDDTNTEGSYYAAAVAKFGKTQSLQSIGGKNIPVVDTFAVVMNSPIPKIEIPFGGTKKISVMPFARTINAIGPGKNEFQPIDPIVGMYITRLDNPSNNAANGDYHTTFLINYEDRSWGGDFEMDVIAEYDIVATQSDVTITVTPKYGASGSMQNIGYVLAGTVEGDGPYLVIQNQNVRAPYYLNVPPFESVGYCNQPNVNIPNLASCETLPNFAPVSPSVRTFKPAATAADPYLKDPLWYAAKWGGYSGDIAPTAPGGTDPDSYAKLTSPAKLRAAFVKAFDAVVDRSASVSGVSSSSSQLLSDTKLFKATFNPKYFTGDLDATLFKVVKMPGTNRFQSEYTSAWPNGSAAAQLAAPNYVVANRKIYYKDTTGNKKEFIWTNIGTPQVNARFTEKMVNYLRGDTSEEVRNNGTFRNRLAPSTANPQTPFVSNVLGSMINSAPVYSDITKSVYVGANDGMVHAFDSDTGAERFAYIPSAAIPNLHLLSETTFSHRYYVDGNIAVSDQPSKTGGVSYVVGFMGRGAKGFYILQETVTSTGVVLTKIIENFGAGDRDMGYLLGRPMIEYLNDAATTPVVIFGNGYNSDNNTPVLYVVKLSDGQLLQKFNPVALPTTDPASGMATPGIVRSGGKLQAAYAGDYLGNVWKFDLSSLSSSSRGYTTGSPKLFTATTGSNATPQPITAPITTLYSFDAKESEVLNKRYVFFGTGSELTVADSKSPVQQTMYGLIDSGRPVSKNLLKDREIIAVGTYGNYRNGETLSVRSFSTPNKSPNDMDRKDGWMMNWTSSNGTSPAEQVVSAAVVRSGSTPTLVVSSQILDLASCVGQGQGFLNSMDAYYGGGLTDGFFDINRDGIFNDQFVTASGNKMADSINFDAGAFGQAGFPGDNAVVQGATGKTGDIHLRSGNNVSRRISWREIVK